MNDRFRQEYQQECAIDHAYEEYVKCWLVYHKTADQIDGHIVYPRNREEYGLVQKAASLARSAMNSYMMTMFIQKPCFEDKELWSRWQSAKLEALRRIGK